MTCRPFSDASLPDLTTQVIPECSNAAESENGHLDEQEASLGVPALALPKMPLPSPARRISVTSEALSHNSGVGTPVVGGLKGPVRESLTSEQVASLEGGKQQPYPVHSASLLRLVTSRLPEKLYGPCSRL